MTPPPAVRAPISGDYMICSQGQGGCGLPFIRGGRAFVLTQRHVSIINSSDGDLPFSEFEPQSGLFCENCLEEIDDAGGILSRRSSRGDFLVSLSWIMKRTLY